jgi:putative two-component system response regulator
MGLALGAVDYIAKLVSPPILFARVATQFTLLDARRQMKEHNDNLENLVQDRTAQLALMQEAIIMATRSFRPGITSAARSTMRARAQHLQGHPRFSAELSDENIDLLYRLASLHDIGKVGIPDREEFEVMKLHVVYGRGTSGFLMLAREIAHSHQEKWDGSGYPERLAGGRIPLSARLMASA